MAAPVFYLSVMLFVPCQTCGPLNISKSLRSNHFFFFFKCADAAAAKMSRWGKKKKKYLERIKKYCSPSQCMAEDAKTKRIKICVVFKTTTKQSIFDISIHPFSDRQMLKYKYHPVSNGFTVNVNLVWQ